jgi:hypothetical protein
MRGERSPERERSAHDSREEREHHSPEARIRHLLEAAEHLELAGLREDAMQFREKAEHMKAELHRHREHEGMDELHRKLREMQEMIRKLQLQNEELQKKLNRSPDADDPV